MEYMSVIFFSKAKKISEYGWQWTWRATVFGLFLDAISVFDFLAQPHTDTEMNMNHLYASQKNVFETIYESRILFSMQNLFPNLFGKSSSDGMDTSQSLPGLPVYHLSISGILMALQGMQFCNAITATFEDSPDARDLSLKLLYQSKKFALDLCNFIQWDYKFWKHKGYSKKEAWELTCLSVHPGGLGCFAGSCHIGGMLPEIGRKGH